MADEQQRRDAEGGTGTGHLVLWAFFALVVYILSIGPAVWLHQKMPSAGLKSVLNVIYMPLGFVIKETPLRPVGEWWIRLWIDLGSDGH